MTLQVALRHRFGGFSLDAAFRAPMGVTALFGRSGSGKTTIVNAVAGLLRPDAGRIVAGDAVVLDTDTGVNLPAHRRRVGYVFQDARLFPHLTVRQNLLYGRWFAGGQGADLSRIVDLLDVAHLLHRRPGALSGGERQRVAIGRAILSNPRLLALDEPLAALDEGRKAEILPYLERLRDGVGLPILYVSHAVAEVVRLADTVVLIDAGRVVAAGPTADILAGSDTAMGFGPTEAGAILTARVVAEEADGLTRAETGVGPIWLPRVAARVGSALRIRILAQDVMLALAPPAGLSALNVLPATIEDIRQDGGAGALVRLDLGGQIILSRITGRSLRAMGLEPGMRVYAVLKAVPVVQDRVGMGR